MKLNFFLAVKEETFFSFQEIVGGHNLRFPQVDKGVFRGA